MQPHSLQQQSSVKNTMSILGIKSWSSNKENEAPLPTNVTSGMRVIPKCLNDPNH